MINLLGIRPFAALEVGLTFAVAASLLVVGVVGLVGAGVNDPISSALPAFDLTWSLLSALLGIALFTFVGVEYTCPLAEELKRPARDIPVGIFIGLGLIAVPVVLYGLAAARYVPPDDALAPSRRPSRSTSASPSSATPANGGMGLVVIAAAIGTLNAVIAGVPRILYGMALTQAASVARSAGCCPRTRAPWVGIIVLAAIPILMNAFGAAEGARFLELILAGVLGWVTAYFLIHVSVVVLRRREPDARRPYRSPLMPLPQILGAGLLALGAVQDRSARDRGRLDLLPLVDLPGDLGGVLARLQPVRVQEPRCDLQAGAARRGLPGDRVDRGGASASGRPGSADAPARPRPPLEDDEEKGPDGR